MSQLKLHEALDDSIKIIKHSNLKLQRITPIGGTSLTASLTSSTQLQINLLNQCSSFYHSFLGFTANFPDPGNTVNITWNYAGLAPIDSLYVVSSNGTRIVSFENGLYFSRAVTPIKTKQDYISYTTSDYDVTHAQSEAAALLYPIPHAQRSNTATAPEAGSATEVNYSAYNQIASLFTGVDTTATFLSYMIPLHGFQETFFEVNTVVSPLDQWRMDINFNNTNKFAWKSTSTTEPFTSASALPSAANLTNVYLYQAIELNQEVINKSNQESMSGRDIIIPYQTSFVRSHASTTNVPLYQTITPSMGQRLLRIYVAIFNGTQTYNTAGQHQDSLITSYYSQLGTQRLNYDGVIETTGGVSWLINRKNLEHSCIISISQYKNRFVVVENFCADPPCMQDPKAVDGIPIMTPLDYSINYTIPSASVYSYMCVVTQRTLSIQGGVATLL